MLIIPGVPSRGYHQDKITIFGILKKHTYLLSCTELGELIDTTLMSSKYEAKVSSQLA